jgi:hypothetical protein
VLNIRSQPPGAREKYTTGGFPMTTTPTRASEPHPSPPCDSVAPIHPQLMLPDTEAAAQSEPEGLGFLGSTSTFTRISAGVLVKSPLQISEDLPDHRERTERNGRAIALEIRLLERLGPHRTIVPCVFCSSTVSMSLRFHETDTWGDPTHSQDFDRLKHVTAVFRSILIPSMRH